MSVLSDRRLRWLSVVLVLSVLAGVSVTVAGAVAVVSAVAGAAAGDVLLVVALRAALPFLLGLATLTVVGAGALGWLLVRALRLAELPRSERLERVARAVERLVPWLVEGKVSRRVAPTVDDRREAVAHRYAAGELTEDELERELERVLADEESATEWSMADGDDAFDRAFRADLARGKTNTDDVYEVAGGDPDVLEGAGGDHDAEVGAHDRAGVDVDHDRR
ncbi:hypothetical protein [Halorubellus litoreus]|uniref:Short C-terminal domain-containing protein n=1 Tax=Halorubellus litoreus TaxID=755308 RepID=A0ABD5V7Q2_9EURY